MRTNIAKFQAEQAALVEQRAMEVRAKADAASAATAAYQAPQQELGRQNAAAASAHANRFKSVAVKAAEAAGFI